MSPLARLSTDSNFSGAASGDCEDQSLLWMFCFVNEFYGLLVATCGIYEAGRLYKGLGADEDAAAKPVDGALD